MRIKQFLRKLVKPVLDEINEQDETGYQLKDAAVISGYDSTVEAAVTKLMHLQARFPDNNIVREYMNRNIAGEITI